MRQTDRALSRLRNLGKSPEEDAIFAEHTDDYWEKSDFLEQKLFRHVFSDDHTDPDALKDILEDHDDFLQTIGVSSELLRIYIAAEIAMVSQEAIQRNVPRERVMEIRRRAFVLLSESNDPGRWASISEEVNRDLHNEYHLLTRRGAERLHPLVRKACNYIYLHRQEPVSARDVASFLKTDRTWLAKLFQSELQTTISDYILSVKMEEAGEWLMEGKYSLPEIATNLGFSSYAYFSKRFKEYYGTSPSMFR